MTVDTKKTVFISHNSDDKPQVERLARLLRAEHGIESWLDKWNLIPGQPWQEAIEEALRDCDAIAICIGSSEFGPWQNREMRRAIDRQVGHPEKPLTVIPVLLPGAERGDRSTLPGFLVDNTWVEFRDGLENSNALARLRAGIHGEEPGDLDRSPSVSTQPYRGLKAFNVEHSRLFFGREALTEWLIEAVRPQPSQRNKSRFIAVLGPSGSGKSSLAKAGLLAQLKSGKIQGSCTWPIIQMRADGDPITTLATALDKQLELQLLPNQLRALIEDLTRNADSLHLQTCRALHDAPGQRLIVFVDQFEEIFATEREFIRLSFIKNLVTAAADVSGQVIVIITMRSDFYGRCATYTSLAQSITNNQFLIGSMSDTELQNAIERPAYRVGSDLEAGLTQRLISDFREQSSGLPLLQFTLEQLWLESGGQNLTNAAYDTLGGLGGALDTYATEVYKTKLDAEQRKACEHIFLRLTQPGEGTEDTKRRVDVKIINKNSASAEALKTLVDTRLITADGSLADSSSAIEISHEALIRHWGQLRFWLAQDRQAHRTQTALSEAANEWEKHDRDISYLYRGARLQTAEEWRANNIDNIVPMENDFLDYSQKQEMRDEQEKLIQAQKLAKEQSARADTEAQRANEQFQTSKKLRYQAWLLGIIAAVAIGFALFGFYQTNEAQAQKNNAEANALEADRQKDSAIKTTKIAEEQRNLAAINESSAFTFLSQSMASNGHYADSTKLALAAWPRSSKDKRPMLKSTLDAIGAAFIKRTRVFDPLQHNDLVVGATYLSEKNQILTWSYDDTARLWDADTGQAIVTMKHDDDVNGATYLSENNRVLTWSDDDTARLWDADTGQAIVTMKHDEDVNGATYLSENNRVLTWSMDNTARLWDTDTGQPIATMKHDDDDDDDYDVVGATYLSENNRVLTWSTDNMARLWNANTGQPIAVMKHDDDDSRINFLGAMHLPERNKILTWSMDSTARLWDADTGQPIAVMKHEDSVYGYGVWGARHLIEHNQILTWAADYTARLWDADTGQAIVTMKHDGVVYGATYLPENNQILTWSKDNTARMWNADTGQLITKVEHAASVFGATYLSKNNRILTWSEDNTARIWDADNGQSIAVMKHDDSVHGLLGATHLPEHNQILTWSTDSTARIWDADTGKPISVMKHGVSRWGVLGATHLPERNQILTWSGDNTAQLWDADIVKPIALVKHEDDVSGATYLSESNQILSWSKDDTARLWDTNTGQLIVTMKHDDDDVSGATHLSEGNRILTWSDDDTARLWDTNTGQLIVTMKHDDDVSGATHLSESNRILTWSDDDTARLWNSDTGLPITTMKHDDDVSGATHLSESNRILTWSDDNTARLWDADTGLLITTMKHKGGVLGATYLPENKQILTWSRDNTARLWDADTGQQIVVLHSDVGGMYGATYLSESNRILTWSYADLQLWEAGQQIALMDHDGHVLGATYLPENKQILTWSRDNTARLWDADTGQPIAVMKHGVSRRGVLGATYLSKSNWILTWSADNNARLWDADTAQPIALMNHDDEVSGASYVPDSNQILTWSTDDTARLWEFPKLTIWENIFNLTCKLWPYDFVSSYDAKYGINTENICSETVPSPVWSVVK